MSKEAMKMALEALNNTYALRDDVIEAIKALEEALASEQEQRSDSEHMSTECVSVGVGEPDYWLGYGLQAHTEKPFEGATPVYTTPQPAQKPWVGLTRQDIDIAFDDTQEGGGFDDFARAIEQRLKEKNT